MKLLYNMPCYLSYFIQTFIGESKPTVIIKERNKITSDMRLNLKTEIPNKSYIWKNEITFSKSNKLN